MHNTAVMIAVIVLRNNAQSTQLPRWTQLEKQYAVNVIHTSVVALAHKQKQQKPQLYKCIYVYMHPSGAITIVTTSQCQIALMLHSFGTVSHFVAVADRLYLV
jgi:hypothetical protein